MPSHAITCGLSAYSQLIVYKALCQMANYPQHFSADAALWASYDTTFTMPIAVMALNYLLVQKSDHPFLVNVRDRWSPLGKGFLVLYGSCMAIVLPKSYLIAYLGYGTAHLLVRTARQLYQM